jgi:hypothetical protein
MGIKNGYNYLLCTARDRQSFIPALATYDLKSQPHTSATRGHTVVHPGTPPVVDVFKEKDTRNLFGLGFRYRYRCHPLTEISRQQFLGLHEGIRQLIAEDPGGIEGGGGSWWTVSREGSQPGTQMRTTGKK